MRIELQPARQRRMADADVRELGDLANSGLVCVEVRVRGRLGRAEQAVVIVDRDLAREHVLARVLVVAVADEALFVARIDRRHAAQRQQHRVRQHDALQHLVVGRLRATPSARTWRSGRRRDCR